MSNAFSNEDVAAAAEVLAESIRRHAAVMVDSDAPVRDALGAIEALRTSARRYEEVIFGTSGWGPVFADLDEDDFDEDDEHDHDHEHDHVVEHGTTPPMAVTVRARYDYLIPDPDALIRAGQLARMRSWDGDPHGAEPVAGVGEAIYELFHLSGATFPALEVGELEPGSGFMTVHHTAAPLEPDDVVGPGVDLEELLISDEEDELLYDLAEPRYATREEAEEAGRRLESDEGM
ncbi:hypothetical protein [Cryptosporangium phraense]|uniref:Uncharacterized protein n=1 Tax=Cryptosporangium phraense TaxID=2593070 RepID=A0A545APF0_9ACTN|nr:hypothetical protein [Cryptosporangium phraense]TQS43131.1 hypothetical protein FL583_19970 [Cryptosporangium phraense]